VTLDHPVLTDSQVIVPLIATLIPREVGGGVWEDQIGGRGGGRG